MIRNMTTEMQIHYFAEPRGPPKDQIIALYKRTALHLSPLEAHGASVQVGYAHRSEDGSMPLLETYGLLSEMHRDLGYIPPNNGHSVVARVKIPAQQVHRLDVLLPDLEAKCGLVRLEQSSASAK